MFFLFAKVAVTLNYNVFFIVLTAKIQFTVHAENVNF